MLVSTIIRPRTILHCTKRFNHTSNERIPNYAGWWTLILDQSTQQPQATHPHEQRQSIQVFPPAEKPPLLPQKIKETVQLDGETIELPEKPEPPDNCCMSGCAHCVWDIYQEDMEEYLEQKSEIRQRFIEANQPVPPSLSSSNKSAAEQVQEEMDPTIRAFVEMERKLGNRN
ncbi:hypothetical protein VTP01DRAFT_1812 [Rhizomucor pusillus]|uniref:uncharacterized protein n=1 Tax=Rhizomucor pusillus TaxID=4840 RepID=UPI003744A553